MTLRVLKRLTGPIKKRYRAYRKRKKAAGKVKYFVIGRNKTGTTSLKKAFEDLGFPVGDQREAEELYDKYYFKSDFDPIIAYCKSAQVFQDVPFSCPDTFKYLDNAFPGSKFILTVRDDAEQWYGSITRFHANKFGKNGRIPTIDDLKNATYVRKGFPYNTVKLHKTADSDPYNKAIMIDHYNSYNEKVIEYFKYSPENLLLVNLSTPGAYQRFIKFIGVSSPYDDFPWENKTQISLKS